MLLVPTAALLAHGGKTGVTRKEAHVGPCDHADEEHVFRAKCNTSVADWESSHRSWPVLKLWIINPDAHGSILGTGQVASLALRLHVMCLRLRRYCYITLYSSQIHKYFGYADGNSWDYDRIGELHPETRNKSIWTTRGQALPPHVTMKHTRYIEGPLYRSLVNETAPYLSVAVSAVFFTRPVLDADQKTGNQKRDQSSTMLTNVSAIQELYSATIGSNQCWLRYVTQPINRSRTEALPRSSVVMHLRTGFADAPQRLVTAIHGNTTATTMWMEAACDDRPLSPGKRPLVLSDSPGVIRWLAEHRGASMGASARMGNDTDNIGTRTWGSRKFLLKPGFQEVEHAAYDDLLTAGYATTLETLAQAVVGTAGRTLRPTSFTWPAIARSVCVVNLAMESAACPRFPDVFLRDFVMSVISGFKDRPPKSQCNATDCNGVGRWSRVYDMSSFQGASYRASKASTAYSQMQRSLIAKHPCKHLPNVAECVLSQIEAMSSLRVGHQ